MVKYKHNRQYHNLNSPNQVVPIILDLFNVDSVVDFGCGLGSWLECFRKLGVKNLLGLDGDWVKEEDIHPTIRPYFKRKDLEKKISLDQKFSISISLEVAEHLEPKAAHTHVKNLINSSDTIIFSAAIPNQGGQNHLNEKPLSYWKDLFESEGFKFYDCLRGKIWNNDKVFWWYRQNIVVFSKERLVIDNDFPVDIVHPELLNQYNNSPYFLKKYFKK